MKALVALFIAERLLITALVVLLGAKFAVYCGFIEKDFSWYYVLAPLTGLILLIPTSWMVISRSMPAKTR